MPWKDLRITFARRVRQKEHSAVRGSKKSPDGYDIADIRPFQVGDLPRTVSRQHLVKFGEMHVKEKLPDRRACVLMLVDLSASLNVGSARKKRDAVLDLAFGIGTGCLHRGHIVRILAFTDRIEHEGRHIGSRNLLLAEIDDLRERECHGTGTDPRPALERALQLATGERPADMTILLSDLLFSVPYANLIEEVSDACETVVMIMEDESERRIPMIAGNFVVRDIETGQRVRASYVEPVDREQVLERAGISRCVLSAADDDYEQFTQVQDFFALRTAEEHR